MNKRPAMLLAVASLIASTSCSSSDANVPLDRTLDTGDFVIVASGDPARRRIGPYHYLRALELRRSYVAALAAFGGPSRLSTDSALKSNLCTVRWAARQLEIRFATSAPYACKPSKLRSGAWFGGDVNGSRWRTDRGLRIGAPEDAIREVYPRARLLTERAGRRVWSLVRERRGEFGLVSTLIGKTRNGTLILLRVPANYTY